MTRGLRVAVILSLACAPAFAASKKDKRCETFGEMSQQLADLRKDGLDEQAAILKMAELHDGAPVDTLQLIPVLSSWVFGLSDKDLGDDVGGAMTAQCKAA
ncbi:MAG: hypothetical protein AAF891_10130 [Pseudomonadota bacterium]